MPQAKLQARKYASACLLLWLIQPSCAYDDEAPISIESGPKTSSSQESGPKTGSSQEVDDDNPDRPLKVGVDLYNRTLAGNKDARISQEVDLAWFDRTDTLLAGEVVDANALALSPPMGLGTLSPMTVPWHNLGFVTQDGNPRLWRRTLHVPAESTGQLAQMGNLMLSHMPGLPHIDCIAISSIHRDAVPIDYIYATLRSLFSELPAEARVNILVGNRDTAYLHPSILAREVGDAYVSRIHVFPPSEAMAARLQTLDKVRRGSWNFARGLLSYPGTSGLLLLEDDVEWAPGSLREVQDLLAFPGVHVLSLFNTFCDRLPGRQTIGSAGRLLLERSGGTSMTSYSQGLFISATIAQSLGRHQLLRLNGVYWDSLIRAFLHLNGMSMFYVYPSVLQHTGLVSSGGWGAPQSKCFLGDS